MTKNNQEAALDVLRDFLRLNHCASAVLDKFAALRGAVSRLKGDGRDYVYIPSTREKPVLMVAHADVYEESGRQPVLQEDDTTICNPGDILGADDRAGCAIIWLLRDLGHGILITDGEEQGSLSVKEMAETNPELLEELNSRYQFMVQIDRCNGTQFKCYYVGSDEFRSYVAKMTGLYEPDQDRSTDICHLAQDICGVNLSCGYQNEHTLNEYIRKDHWLHDLEVTKEWLSCTDLPRFTL